MADLLGRLFGPTALVSGDNSVFTGTALHQYSFRTIVLFNASTATRTVRIGIGGVADGNTIWKTVTLSAGATAAITYLVELTGAEVLHINTSGGSVTATGSGLDQS